MTYQNKAGETRMICLDMFPVPIFERARLDQSSDVAVTENTNISSEDNFFDVILSQNPIKKLAGVYIAIGAGMLLIEFFLYSVFAKLFRE